MIPEVDFQMHKVLIDAFFFPMQYGGNRDVLQEDIESFITLFRQYENKVLTLIEKYSGFNWTEEQIPVYIVPDCGVLNYSYTHFNLCDGLPGVFQKLKHGKEKLAFSIFIHELCHVNQMQSDFRSLKYKTITEQGVRDTDRIELSADLVMMQILKDLFGVDSEYEKIKWDFLKNTNEKNRKKGENLEKYLSLWDLNKASLKTYLES